MIEGLEGHLSVEGRPVTIIERATAPRSLLICMGSGAPWLQRLRVPLRRGRARVHVAGE